MVDLQQGQMGHGGEHTPRLAVVNSVVVDLFDEIAPADTLAIVARKTIEARRGAGRPEGSPNRRNVEMFQYFEALGYKGPERHLLELVAADPRELAAKLAGVEVATVTFERAMAVFSEQRRAAADLMRYKFAPRTDIRLEKTEKSRHVFVGGVLSSQQVEVTREFNLTGNSEDLQALSEFMGTTVSQAAVSPIAQPLENSELTNERTSD